MGEDKAVFPKLWGFDQRLERSLTSNGIKGVKAFSPDQDMAIVLLS